MSTEARVTTLEQAMLRTQESLLRLSEETRVSLARLSEETRVSLERLSEEMRLFKDEMRLFKDEMRAFGARADRQWGELANKMGTLAEDIVAPGIPAIFRTVLGSEVEPDLTVRTRRRHRTDGGRMQEFDVIASASDLCLVNETRSRLTPQDVTEFVAVLQEAREFLPEMQQKRIVGALASFHVDPSLVAAAERQGLLVLGLASGLMEILNSPGFRPRQF